MSKEQESHLPEVSAIRIQRTEGSLTFVIEAGEKPVAQLTFPAMGSISFQARPAAVETESSETEAVAADEHQERAKTITLSGKLKTAPRPGRPDRNGKPTAWARFAAHVEGERDAHYYLATFHRHTTRIALGLAKEAAITVEGYAHPKTDPASNSLDTFSVINFLSHPQR